MMALLGLLKMEIASYPSTKMTQTVLSGSGLDQSTSNSEFDSLTNLNTGAR